jgi:hypothetical protein
VTCFNEISQYLRGGTNILYFDQTLMVVVTAVLLVVVLTMMTTTVMTHIGTNPASQFENFALRRHSLIHSHLQLALLQSLFPTQ